MPLPTGRPIPAKVAQRAYDAWECSASGCYISTYSTGSHGYAQVGCWMDGKSYMTTAHRAAWVHANGQIPLDMTVDHKPTCDRRCVNVTHLRLLSNFENARRSFGDDWPLGECKNGHPNSELRQYRKHLRCRLCVEDEKVRYRNKQRVA